MEGVRTAIGLAARKSVGLLELAHPSRGGAAKPRGSRSQPGYRKGRPIHVLEWLELDRRACPRRRAAICRQAPSLSPMVDGRCRPHRVDDPQSAFRPAGGRPVRVRPAHRGVGQRLHHAGGPGVELERRVQGPVVSEDERGVPRQVRPNVLAARRPDQLHVHRHGDRGNQPDQPPPRQGEDPCGRSLRQDGKRPFGCVPQAGAPFRCQLGYGTDPHRDGRCARVNKEHQVLC